MSLFWKKWGFYWKLATWAEHQHSPNTHIQQFCVLLFCTAGNRSIWSDEGTCFAFCCRSVWTKLTKELRLSYGSLTDNTFRIYVIRVSGVHWEWEKTSQKHNTRIIWWYYWKVKMIVSLIRNPSHIYLIMSSFCQQKINTDTWDNLMLKPLCLGAGVDLWRNKWQRMLWKANKMNVQSFTLQLH